MDNEMIDRVAQNLKNAGLNCVNIKDIYPQELAIAAIKAMREPTDKMLALGPEVQCWPEVIDAIVGDE